MKKHGLTVHSVPAPIEAKWVAGARRGYGSLVGKIVPKAMVDEVQRLRDAFRAKNGK